METNDLFTPEISWWTWSAIKAGAALLLLFLSCFTVEQQTAAVIERFGKYLRIAKPGLNIKIPFIDTVAERISLRVEQLDLEVETNTKDNVFVKVKVSVPNRVLAEKVYEAYYELNEPEEQMTKYVLDAVRSKVPDMELDEALSSKDEIATAINARLTGALDQFGYVIVKALVTDIEPDEKVKHSMNEINAQKRLRIAATEKGEADKILLVKAAEAESASKILQGQGIAGQRLAIAKGMKESIAELAGIAGVHATEAMQMITLNQYFDAMVHMAQHGKTNTIMVPHSPAGVTDLADQIRNSLLLAHKANEAATPAPVATPAISATAEQRADMPTEERKDDDKKS